GRPVAQNRRRSGKYRGDAGAGATKCQRLHRDLGASYFDIGDAWNAATSTERLAANQHLLDIAIKNKDTITLSVPFYRIEPNTFTAAEIRYFQAHGYQ